MSKVIEFTPPPLTPFLGEWVRDPISVSRNKVGRRVLGEDGLKKLWACGSMQELTGCLDADPALAERYQALLRIGRFATGTHMAISLQAIVWKNSEDAAEPAAAWVFPVLKVAAEGRKLIVQAVDTRPEKLGKPIAYVFRMNKQWLFASERYQGAEARLFPPSPTFRYYRHS